MDELYTYDDLHRLADFHRDDLNGSYNGMTSTINVEQAYTLDQLGNPKVGRGGWNGRGGVHHAQPDRLPQHG